MREHFEENRIRYIKYIILFNLMIACFRPYVIKFLTRLGGTPFDIALFNATKGIAMILVVLPGVFLIDRTADKKRITGWLILAIATLSLLNVFVPLAPDNLQPLTFILLAALLMIPMAIYDPSYRNITGELFPDRRSQVVARSNMFSVATMTVFSLSSGLAFRFLAKNDQDYITIYQILFVLSFIFGIAAYLIFKRFYYQPAEDHKRINLKNSIAAMRRNGPFKKFVGASVLFHFGWQMGWPLFGIYMINTLGADELWLAVINVGAALAMMIGHRLWPVFIDKYGHQRASTVSTLGMAITPLLYAMSPNLLTLAILSSISGIFTSGVITVLFTDLLEVAPDQNRIIFIGVHSTLTNITLAISPFVGHWIFSNFNIYIALIATAVFRIIGSAAFLVRERNT